MCVCVDKTANSLTTKFSCGKKTDKLKFQNHMKLIHKRY